MNMSRIYTDYLKETTLTIPDKFIDVKTGESQSIAPIVQEQIAYHAENNTLIHLVLSALNHYFFHPRAALDTNVNDMWTELLEIKQLIQHGNSNRFQINHTKMDRKIPISSELNVQEIADVLEAFGG